MTRARAFALVATAMALGAALPLPGAAAAQEAGKRVVEIRIFGNHETTDEEILAAAGLSPGDTVDDARLEAVRARLEAAGYRDVEILERYRSLTATDEVVLILSLRERVPASSKFLFLPEVHYNEDEKFSIGGRASSKSLLGGGELISIPVTVLGVDRAALEISRAWDSGYGVGGSFEYRHFTNPFYNVGDERLRGAAYFERALGGALRARLFGSWEDVDFGGQADRLWRYGARVALDTRPNSTFPYDSVLARATWEGLDADSSGVVNRWRLELAGYKTLFGPVVLAARGLYESTDAPLPLYERPYVGGMVSLRGTRAGTYSGDGQMLGTVEMRVPLTTMSGFGRAGLTLFWDTAAVWDHGGSVSHAPFHHGVGAGVFLQVPIVRLNLDVGNDLEGSTRVHFGLGFRF